MKINEDDNVTMTFNLQYICLYTDTVTIFKCIFFVSHEGESLQ